MGMGAVLWTEMLLWVMMGKSGKGYLWPTMYCTMQRAESLVPSLYRRQRV